MTAYLLLTMTKKEQNLLNRIDRAKASYDFWCDVDSHKYGTGFITRKLSGYRSKLNKLKKLLAEERTLELPL